MSSVGDMTLAQIQSHIADQPVDAKRIKGLPSPVTGQIASAGTITAGTGFTVNRSGTGVYDITFTTAFSAVPTILTTCATVGGLRNAYVTAGVTTTTATIETRDAGGVSQNSAFNFVAYTTV